MSPTGYTPVPRFAESRFLTKWIALVYLSDTGAHEQAEHYKHGEGTKSNQMP